MHKKTRRTDKNKFPFCMAFCPYPSLCWGDLRENDDFWSRHFICLLSVSFALFSSFRDRAFIYTNLGRECCWQSPIYYQKTRPLFICFVHKIKNIQFEFVWERCWRKCRIWKNDNEFRCYQQFDRVMLCNVCVCVCGMLNKVSIVKRETWVQVVQHIWSIRFIKRTRIARSCVFLWNDDNLEL